jgi:hypothetical protein
MTELGLRPRSATELVDAAFQIFRRDAVPFMTASAVFYVPYLVVRLMLGADAVVANPAAVQWGPLLIGAFLGLIAYGAAAGATILLAREAYFDRPMNLGGALGGVASRLAPLLIAGILSSILTGIGALFFLIPGIYLLARFSVIQPVVMIEDADVGQAFSRTSTLTQGQKWHVLGTIGLLFVIAMAVSLGIGFTVGMIHSQVVAFAASTIVAILVYPFGGIILTLLYYDLRIRKEGFDIEYLAGQTAPSAPPVSG